MDDVKCPRCRGPIETRREDGGDPWGVPVGAGAWCATGVDAGQTVFEASFVEEEDARGAADAFERCIADAVRNVARGMGETNPPVFWLTAHPYNDQIPANTLVRAEVL